MLISAKILKKVEWEINVGVLQFHSKLYKHPAADRCRNGQFSSGSPSNRQRSSVLILATANADIAASDTADISLSDVMSNLACNWCYRVYSLETPAASATFGTF